MDKTIITAFLIIAGVISAVFLFNTVYPAVVESSAVLVGMERRIDDRARSQIAIVHIVSDGTVTDRALVWVKNVGATSVRAVEACDVFFGLEGSYSRIPYGAGSAYWTYEVEDGDSWDPSKTLKVTITMPSNLTNGARYYFKFVLPNGVSETTYFAHVEL